jgi:biotin operon repressor
MVQCRKFSSASRKHPSIEGVSELTGIHRNTVSKYVFAFEKDGKLILSRRLGNAKLYTPPSNMDKARQRPCRMLAGRSTPVIANVGKPDGLL